jgi:hypothetical protein
MGVNNQHKDSVFSLLFNDAEALRELYGALGGVPLDPQAHIEITTLSDVLYMEQLNDISFTVDNRLVVLIEHQSTINPNMPLRLLMYIARVYEKLVEARNIYSGKRLVIPRPEFFVLYNGKRPYPDEDILRLSESFEKDAEGGTPGTALELDLMVRVYNINDGHNEALVRRCKKLEGYSIFIARIREYERQTAGKEAAMKLAISWCIEHNILKGFLEQNGSEVINMLLAEWNIKDALAVQREEGMEEGMERGMEAGMEKGLEEGKLETARNALAKGWSPEEVAEITELDIETVKALCP